MGATLSNIAASLTFTGALALAVPGHCDTPPNQSGTEQTDSKSGISIDALNKEFKSLSPEARSTLMRQLEQRGVAGISNMSPDQARQAFAGLPENVRTELQAKWDSLSDEQREAIKQLGPDAVKKMFADKIKEAIKPPQAVVDAGKSVVEKSKAAVDKTRTFLRRIWSKFTGGEQDNSGDGSQMHATGG